MKENSFVPKLKSLVCCTLRFCHVSSRVGGWENFTQRQLAQRDEKNDLKPELEVSTRRKAGTEKRSLRRRRNKELCVSREPRQTNTRVEGANSSDNCNIRLQRSFRARLFFPFLGSTTTKGARGTARGPCVPNTPERGFPLPFLHSRSENRCLRFAKCPSLSRRAANAGK